MLCPKGFLMRRWYVVFVFLVVLGTAESAGADAGNSYVFHPMVANKKKYKADVVEKDFVNAWGLADRPAGAGGHFWVTAKDVSYEYVGDVRESADEGLRRLHTDTLKYVKLPVGGKDHFATGVVFLDSKSDFVVKQAVAGAEDIEAPAKFAFASDGGIISAWTERKKADGSFDRPGEALTMIDRSAQGAQYFGLATSAGYDRLYAANFGTGAGIEVFDGAFKPAEVVFEQPFDVNKNGKVDAGEYAPFNVQLLKNADGEAHVFVAYAKTQSCPAKEAKKGACVKGEVFAGEEDTVKPGQGRVAEFTEDGKLVAVWEDGGHLSAPWGMAFAPKDFGALSGMLLVGNFGDGSIAAYDARTRIFVDVMRDAKGRTLKVDKLWGVMFGNGASLGDANALYVAAGPEDEGDGVFGSIRMVGK